MSYTQESIFDSEDEAKVPASPADNQSMNPREQPLTIEQLKRLEAGDILQDQDGVRHRVQKQNVGGLRLRSNDGAQDFTWYELETGRLTFKQILRSEDGPAARRLGDLRKAAEQMGIDTSNLTTLKEIERAMGEKMAEGRDVLEQVDPQLASDAKKLFDYSLPKPWMTPAMQVKYWTDDRWSAEEKLDGVRIKLHWTETAVRADSRRADTKTRLFSEKTPNFLHLMNAHIPALAGTVLDTEAIIPVKSGIMPSGNRFYGCLPLSTATCNAGPDMAAAIQEKFGPMQFHAFDLLFYRGRDIRHWPFWKRRKMLQEVVTYIINHSRAQSAADWLFVTNMALKEDKLPFYESIIAEGGEGVILKDLDAAYETGKRGKSWQKVKRFQEVDAFVTGYIPGKEGNEGLVGALELSVTINENALPTPVAAVSQVTLEERKAMTAPDGSLKPEYYGRVVTFRGQELSKNGRFRHAIFVTWREDKTKEQCNGYEIVDELLAMGIE